MPDWEHCGRVNEILGRALSKDPSLRYQTCLELSDELSNLQIGTYDALAESLGTLVRSNSSADWKQIARLTRSARNSALLSFRRLTCEMRRGALTAKRNESGTCERQLSIAARFGIR